MPEEQENKSAGSEQMNEVKGLITEIQHKNQQMMLLLVAILLFGITGIILLHQRLGKVRDDVSRMQQVVSSQGRGSYDRIMRELSMLEEDELKDRVEQWEEMAEMEGDLMDPAMMEGGMEPPPPPPEPAE